MKQLENFLTDIKNNTLIIEGTHGGDFEEISPKKKNDNFVLLGLKEIINDNNNWLKILFGLIILLMVLLVILIWRWQGDKEYLFALLGGQGVSILFCINRLTHFYNQKRTSEILLVLYQSATTPSEKKRLIDEVLAFLTKRKAGKDA